MRTLLLTLLLLSLPAVSAPPKKGPVEPRLAQCPGSVAKGCADLAEQHLLGKTVPRDLSRAAHLLSVACVEKHEDSCLRLRNLLGEGDFQLREAEEVLVRSRLACRGRSAHACEAAALLRGQSRWGIYDLREAFILSTVACHLKQPGSCLNAARALESGKVEVDDPLGAETYYRKACLLEDGEGCAKAARAAHQRGDTAALSDFATRGCALGSQDACLMTKFGSAQSAYEKKLEELERQERESQAAGRAR